MSETTQRPDAYAHVIAMRLSLAAEITALRQRYDQLAADITALQGQHDQLAAEIERARAPAVSVLVDTTNQYSEQLCAARAAAIERHSGAAAAIKWHGIPHLAELESGGVMLRSDAVRMLEREPSGLVAVCSRSLLRDRLTWVAVDARGVVPTDSRVLIITAAGAEVISSLRAAFTPAERAGGIYCLGISELCRGLTGMQLLFIRVY